MQINEVNTQAGNCAAALTLTAIDCKSASVIGATLSVTVATPAAVTFTAAVTDICTAVAHGYATGLRVAASTTVTLPAGLSATNYWIIKIDADTFKLASSAVNALAGTAVDITDTGTGVHTLTPASITGGSYKTQVSMDGTTYVDLVTHDLLPVGQNITVTNGWYWDWDKPAFNYFRIVFACTTGQFAYSLVSTTKE